LQVRYQNRPMGPAVPHRISRHVHPDAGPDTPAAPAPPTGIDYLALVTAQHRQSLAARISYTDLPTGQPTDPDTADDLDTAEDVDIGLDAELASFTALRHQLVDGELPGQLDLTVLTDEPTEPGSDDDPDQVGQR